MCQKELDTVQSFKGNIKQVIQTAPEINYEIDICYDCIGKLGIKK